MRYLIQVSVVGQTIVVEALHDKLVSWSGPWQLPFHPINHYSLYFICKFRTLISNLLVLQINFQGI